MDWTNFERVKEVFPNRTENHAKIGTGLDGAKTARTELPTFTFVKNMVNMWGSNYNF